MESRHKPHPEQLHYATVLHWSTLAGFIELIATCIFYMFGWLPANIPLQQLPQLWGLSASEFLRATGMQTGWSWLFMMGKGDSASQLGIAMLSACSIACILAVMPDYAKSRNFTYLMICTLEVAVLVVSASGFFTAH